MEQRVNDLVSRLTLEEKVAQMLNAAPAIPRLGIPAYDWWNEVLHGVARTPFKATVFPQAIGMAATWDTNSLKTMAQYAALEGRAIHNKATALGRNNERYMGLTYWTPNINIFRDPRWGRGQETYGEDPYLTAKLGAAFVRGLQGDDPKYMLAAACAKHYAVHSGPEASRHADDFDVSAYELWDTYLPAFRELVTEANVAGVMCAYNRFRTQPCCANDLLMNDILRRQWNFAGYVTSDCWALNDFYNFHKTHPDAQSSAVDALLHGTDVECGVSVYNTLVIAVKSGQLKGQQIDESVKRLFTLRYRLGMFDPVSMVKYAQTPESVLESPAHQAHALKMASQSIVLLKNEQQSLPLSKSIRRIAVVGPNADNKIAVLGNYNGTPSRVVSVLDGIKAKLGANAAVVYEQAINFTNDTLFVPISDKQVLSFRGMPGFEAAFFNNEKLEGNPVHVSMVKDLNFWWSEGETPAWGVQPFHFSARFTATLRADKDASYTWLIEGDDGYRLLVNDSVMVNAWTRNRWGAKTYKLEVKSGKEYKVVLEYWQNEGPAVVRMQQGEYRKTDRQALASRLKTADAIVFVGGISPQLEGEEMPVAVPGFSGGDKTSILLPAVQTELLKTLQATGKPVVFVMMTGSALSAPWENENLPAIVNAWYGGQSAGTAVADVLFGDYNPAGRLPVTFYKSDDDLPDFKNYSMKGRTYRYFKGNALYPFGFGLSYSRFAYSALQVPAKIAMGKPVTVSVKVKNTGNYDGEEVVQLYVRHENAGEYAPIKALKGFQRIVLKKGEEKTVLFELSLADLSLVDANGKEYQPTGKVMISVGGGQPDVGVPATSNVLKSSIIVQ
jgi:beta-glucosidase